MRYNELVRKRELLLIQVQVHEDDLGWRERRRFKKILGNGFVVILGEFGGYELSEVQKEQAEDKWGSYKDLLEIIDPENSMNDLNKKEE